MMLFNWPENIVEKTASELTAYNAFHKHQRLFVVWK